MKISNQAKINQKQPKSTKHQPQINPPTNLLRQKDIKHTRHSVLFPKPPAIGESPLPIPPAKRLETLFPEAFASNETRSM